MKKILVIKLAAVGEVVRTTFLLKGLKEKYRRCEIHWVTSNQAVDLLRNNRMIDKLSVLRADVKIKYRLLE